MGLLTLTSFVTLQTLVLDLTHLGKPLILFRSAPPLVKDVTAVDKSCQQEIFWTVRLSENNEGLWKRKDFGFQKY